ncbi:sigma 54-interacting transcriptional regulator [Tissierella pigra]|uniref:sigma-54 interaction domain-containing protein n=1 Tax=Tissierella pigra TaxID=2607614 RepID=UPI001C10383A|nr:sigma 54-interacting transcriptional regulator [Tissierella pigra]MBU5427942.1 sigma 54-interacting transcriptional regulator [Tissierella pigra]
MKDLFFRENVLDILDYLEEGLHIIDKNGIIVYYNKFAQGIDGIDREKVIGRHLLEVYPSLTDETSTLLTVIRTGEPLYKKEQTFINYKGEKITTINTSIPIKSKGRIVGALEISKDITTVRQMSEKIVELQDKLYNKKQKPSTKKTNESAEYTLLDIIGEDKEILRLKSIVLKAGESDISVLVSGDTGTGKELFVHSIHNVSHRSSKPFITQNCAALPANLLEGILFGTIKGGFTGAEDRPGLFELAHGGTLFLDEINSMPLELQSKLLRVLQDGNIRRVGATNTIKVDVRIIAATNIPPEEAIEKRQIRKDLYYRLNVLSLEIPPLRERKGDIPILVNYFINKFNKKFDKKVENISNEVLNIFNNYDWSGNVRELEHLLEGIIGISDKKILEVEDLPYKFKKYKKETIQNLSLTEILETTEKEIIKEALGKTDNNITKTAEILGIPRQTLQYKIQRLKL